jgi:hypothetical protein
MCPLRAAARLGALLDRKGLLKQDEAKIKSFTKQLAQRTSELPDQQEAFQRYLNVQMKRG